MAKGTASETTICGTKIGIGDFVMVRYRNGDWTANAVISGRITEIWDPASDGHHQARVESGWCFHDKDEIVEHLAQAEEGGGDESR